MDNTIAALIFLAFCYVCISSGIFTTLLWIMTKLSSSIQDSKKKRV